MDVRWNMGKFNKAMKRKIGGSFRYRNRVKPEGRIEAVSFRELIGKVLISGKEDEGLMEQVLDADNLQRAWGSVKANKGAPGIDGLSIADTSAVLNREWPRIHVQLLAVEYMPKPVRQVEIPKADGGVRRLGIPTVVDRLIQQAIAQTLSPIFDPEFSESSYGFRPGRSAHQAVTQAKTYINENRTWVVDIDIESFFDKICHDKMMARVMRKVSDRRVLQLMRRYLRAGIMVNGICMARTEGTPQGGPLSPLLANIMLDDLDKMLERRGQKFCRYADDCNVYLRSRRAAERVMKWMIEFLEKKLSLKVNVEKSAIGRPWERKFLGFSFTQDLRIKIADKSVKQFKQRVRELTKRRRNRDMGKMIGTVNIYLRGWLRYFGLTEASYVLKELDGWIRHRCRAQVLSNWSRCRTKIRELKRLGIKEIDARCIASSGKGAWRNAKTPQLHKALDLKYWATACLFSLADAYTLLKSVQTAKYGPVRLVV